MLSTQNAKTLLTFAAVAMAGLIAITTNVNAAVIINSTAPTVDGADIANLTWTDTATDKTFSDTANHGQSFTTGNESFGYTLNSVSLQTNTTSSTDPPPGDREWNIRVVSIDGNDIDTSTVALETGHLQPSGPWSQGDWFTFTLDNPVALSPNTVYGIDVEHTAGSDWRNGIPYLRYNRSNDVTGSYRYTRGDGDPSTINAATGHDRVFHVDMASAIPEPSTFALAALGLLGLVGITRRRKR